jgi:DNA repair exonuclease SbcCD nuclease subunit
MKLYLISDTHFGVRSNSKEWNDIIEDYFYNFFIPHLEKTYQPGDIMIHCGDVFDNRTSLNLNILNSAYNIFLKISQILPVHIIIGNHDIYLKKSNHINSLVALKNIPNIKVYEAPEVLKIGNQKALMMPWIDDKDEFVKIINNYKGIDYLFCHIDITNLRFNKNVIIDHGVDPNDLKSYKKVFSGHIHLSQTYKNIVMLGSPYELTRSDSENQKNITRFYPENDKIENIANDLSPKFKKIKLDWVIEKTLGEISGIIRNNFIDILIKQDNAIDFPISKLIETLNELNPRKINIVVQESKESDNNIQDQSTDANFSIPNLINIWIDEQSYPDDLKKVLKNKSLEIFKSFSDENN